MQPLVFLAVIVLMKCFYVLMVSYECLETEVGDVTELRAGINSEVYRFFHCGPQIAGLFLPSKSMWVNQFGVCTSNRDRRRDLQVQSESDKRCVCGKNGLKKASELPVVMVLNKFSLSKWQKAQQ